MAGAVGEQRGAVRTQGEELRAAHAPEDAEKHAAQVPGYRDAPEAAVTAFAASITAYWGERAGQGVPELRRYRERALKAGQAWEAYRRG
ncbi:hypothetical protein ACFCWD_26615 [Streptomyces sp. NPDC056374]|uniref:hypothetical protein n=1 Tax=unclassified Streptomyces TaxID=2593676 RepID=UPI0035DBC694